MTAMWQLRHYDQKKTIATEVDLRRNGLDDALVR
jgi:hypothetical protein